MEDRDVPHKITRWGWALLLGVVAVGPAGAQAPAQPPDAKAAANGLTPEQLELAQRIAADLKDLRNQVARLPEGPARQQMLQIIARLEGDSRNFAELTAGAARSRLAVPDDVLAKLLKALQNQNFDDNRLPVLRQGTANARFTSDQARMLVAAFAASGARKRAAIVLYPRILDPNNFSMVLDTIPFNVDREDVLKAIMPKQ
jgi:hypothetical protein